jgi:MerC mercury resistance protein
VASPDTLTIRADDDRLAAGLSSLCLLHCLALPLALALLPAFADSPLGAAHSPHWVHWALIAVALPFSLSALRRGYIGHGNLAPALIAGGGFALVTAGALLHGAGPSEQLLTVAGGLLVAAAHWRNWRMRGLG